MPTSLDIKPVHRHYVYRLAERYSTGALFTVGYYTEFGDWVPHVHVAGLHATQCATARLNGVALPPPKRCDKTLDIFTGEATAS